MHHYQITHTKVIIDLDRVERVAAKPDSFSFDIGFARSLQFQTIQPCDIIGFGELMVFEHNDFGIARRRVTGGTEADLESAKAKLKEAFDDLATKLLGKVSP